VRLAEHFGMDYIAIGLATADATLRGAAILGGAEHPSGAALGFHLLGSMRWAYDGHFDGPTDFPDSRVGDVFRFRYDPDLLTATVDLNGTRLQAYNLLDGGMRGPVHVAVLFEGRGAVDLLDGDFSAAAEPPPSLPGRWAPDGAIGGAAALLASLHARTPLPASVVKLVSKSLAPAPPSPEPGPPPSPPRARNAAPVPALPESVAAAATSHTSLHVSKSTIRLRIPRTAASPKR